MWDNAAIKCEKPVLRFLGGVFISLLAGGAIASGQGQPLPGPAIAGTVVPAGTVLEIRLTQPLSSYASKRGIPIHAEVIAPVVVEGRIVMPR